MALIEFAVMVMTVIGEDCCVWVWISQEGAEKFVLRGAREM